MIHHQRYRTRAQVTQEITEYIGVFYNLQRNQARFRHPLSSAAFMQRYDDRNNLTYRQTLKTS
ncbi:MAG: IS3 family transposase [Nitrosomonadales bacterium]|nr:IS3 family transposase [Nitrosomonadales bacterium]